MWEGVQLMINTTSDFEKYAKIARAADAGAICNVFQKSRGALVINIPTMYVVMYIMTIVMYGY